MEPFRMPRNPIRDQKTVLLFINQMKRHPCLWDQTDVSYRNANARKEAWISIARKIGQNVSILRRKWRSLTCHYFKLGTAMKLGSKPKSKVSGSPCPMPTWFAYSAMDFLGNSKNVRRERGKHAINYIILGEEHNRASEECELNEMAQLEDEEIEDNYETTMEENLAEATSEYAVSYDTMNGKVEEDTSAVLYHEQNNVDDALDDDGISLEQRYINEKRKSILLYELNAKLEKDLQQHKAEMQLQKLKIETLEQKLKLSERKTTKLTNSPQEHFNTIISEEVQNTKETLVHGTILREPRILTIQPINDVAGQCDPLYNPTGITDSDNNSEPLHLMTSSIKKIQSAIENFANQSERRYSGFGDFMVRELNEMDEQTSIRLINEITSMLKKEGDGHRNTRGNVK